MNVTLDTYTHRPVDVCATAARTCYSSEIPEDINLSYEQAVKLLSFTIKSGHLSVLEHATFTFHISGVSRALTHQLVRHRVASYSQQSQRYVNMENADYVTPPSCDSSLSKSKTISGTLTKADLFNEAMDNAWNSYRELVASGVSEEDARYVLPNACTTNIVVTMNARELLHFFNVRLCNRAQWEIRAMAQMMYDECMLVAPEIFRFAGPNCWTSKCIESKPCGNPPKKVSP